MPSDNIYELFGCTGRVAWDGYSLEVSFAVRCDLTGRVRIELAPLPLDDHTVALLHLHHEVKRTVPKVRLEGQGPGGEIISDPRTFLIECVTHTDQVGTSLRAVLTSHSLSVASRVSDQRPSEGATALVRYYVPGLRSAGQISLPTALGQLTLSAGMTVENFATITGHIDFALASLDSYDAPGTDAFVDRVLDILSLADGRIMDWSIRHTLMGPDVLLFFSGSGTQGEPKFPLFSHLNLEPLLTLAIERYNAELIAKTGMDVAIHWHLIRTPFLEADFLAGMTALEHLVSQFESHYPPGPLLLKPLFKSVVLPTLLAALDEGIALLSDDLDKSSLAEIFTVRLKGINRNTLLNGIRSMLRAYSVPFDDLDAQLPSLVSLRNDVVHFGRRREVDVHTSILDAMLRELLSRVFLSLLGYSGQYQSYLDGPEWKEFGRVPGGAA